MGKYIIHFDDKHWQDLDDELYYRCFEIPWFSTTKTTISRLTPYTEDSAYAHGYTEAESKYREIRDELEKQAYQRGYETAKHECEDCQKIRYDAEQELVKKAYDTAYADAEEIYDSGKRAMYQKGLKDAWEAARKIVLPGDVSGIYLADLEEIFDRSSLQDVIKDYSASECIEKIRAYEQEKKELFLVGDEVEGDEDGQRGVVIDSRFENSQVAVLTGNSKVYSWWSKCAIHKTGRHFPEIAEVMQKMKESDNG